MSQLLTVKEASSYLKVHPNTVYKWIEERKIQFIRLNGLIRFSKNEIDSWQSKNTSKIYNTLGLIPKLDLSLQDYDRMLLKGDSAVSKKRQRWNYGNKGVFKRKLKSGYSWCYWYYEKKGKVKKVTVPGATCKEDAILAMEKRVREVFNQQHGIRKKETKFKDFSVIYLEKYAKPKKKSWNTDRKFLHSQLIPFFDDVELSEITPWHVSEFIVKRQMEGVKNSTINKHLQVLRKMMNLADEFDYEVEKNPVRPFHFTNEIESRRTRVLSYEEETHLMREAALHLKPIIQTALQTGMRLQEILKLRVDDVDLSQDTISIRPDVNKTGKLDVIPLPFSLKEMLRTLIQENGGRTEYVFNYNDPRTNEYRPISSVQHGFQAACRRAKIKSLQFRDLRRTFGTRLHEKGVDPLIIQRLLRHSSFKISEQVYIQSSLRMMKEAVNGALQKTVKPVKMEHIWNTEELEEGKTPVNPWLSMN